jgi:uncharacterized membrane protein (UPF0182 family)
MLAIEFPPGVNIDGPTQVFSRINADARFSQERTLLGQGGSNIRFGDLLVIPIEQGLLYVEPVFVVSNQANAIPELKRVLVVNGGTVGIGDTLRDALNDSLGQIVAPPGGGGGQPPPSGSVQEQINALIQQAVDHFAKADAALKAGDLATYQAEINAAQAAISRANELAAGQGGGGTSPTPSPTPSASASPSP